MILPVAEGLYIVEKTRSKLKEGNLLPSQFLSSFHPLSSKAAKFLDSKSFYCTIPKGRYLLREGQVCPYIFLVHKGLFRGVISEGKNEITTWFTGENDLVSSISSFFNQTPSFETVQALEDAELTGISHEDLQIAYQKHPELNIAARLILQVIYQQAEQRAYLSRLSKASSRYEYFVSTKPQFINRLPLKYIASHLGMKLETLSRLRGSMNRAYKEFSEEKI